MPNPNELRVLRKEIEADLAAVNRLMRDLAEARSHVPAEPTQRDLSHIGYLLHCIYTAWESAFHRIATVFENCLDPSQWHVQLLRRMTLDIPEIRPAVIDDATCEHLVALRSFRHFFRHSYAVRLRWPRMMLALDAFDEAQPLVASRLLQFLDQIEQIARQSEGTSS